MNELGIDRKLNTDFSTGLYTDDGLSVDEILSEYLYGSASEDAADGSSHSDDSGAESSRTLIGGDMPFDRVEPDYDAYFFEHGFGYDADPTRFDDSAAPYSFRSKAEPDSRFDRTDKSSARRLRYGEEYVDQSAEKDYAPAEQSEYAPSSWTPVYDEPGTPPAEEELPPRKKHKLRLGRKKRREEAPVDISSFPEEAGEDIAYGFEDEQASHASYAPEHSYKRPSDKVRSEGGEESFPLTFKDYILSLFASAFLRIRGTARGDTAATMRDTEEDLGAELSPAAASKYYGSFIRSTRLRLRIASVLLLILVYVSLSLPVPGMLKTLPVAAAFCFALQSAIMLLALDVVTNAVLNAVHLKAGIDSLAVLSCILTGIDAMTVAVSDLTAPHMPLCALSSLSVVGLLLASLCGIRGLRKALRVPAIAKRFYSVTGEIKTKGRELTLLKSLRPFSGFVHRCEEAGLDETVFRKLSPFILLLSFLLSVIIAAVKNSFSELLFIFSAVLAPAVPFAAMLSFPLPFFLGSSRIFKHGAAIAGWSGVCDIGNSKNLIVTDRDLFPESTISIESVRIFADGDAEDVISFAGTLMDASGCCSAACFSELMEENGCRTKQVQGFEMMPGGGMKGIIDGHVVLCGSTDLMRLMNVRIPYRLTDKTTVLLAIDGILYGIFSLHYEPLPQVRSALVELMRSNRHPVFAINDFNINPEMLHSAFDLPTDGYDFPPFTERFEMTRPSEDKDSGRIAAVICSEGLGALTAAADTGRKIYTSTRLNVLISVFSAVFGMFTVFVRLLSMSQISLGAILIYMVFWALPVFAVSFFNSLR